MGKFLRRSIRADAVILESLRSRATRSSSGGVGMELKRKPVAESGEFNERKLAKRRSSCTSDEEGELLKELSSNAGGEDPGMNPTSRGEEEEELGVHQESDSNWIEEEDEAHNKEEEKEEEEEDEEGEGGGGFGVVVVRGTNSRLLRASHSDSCLKSRAFGDPIGTAAGHSRSNSASFSHEQSLGLALPNTNSSLELQNPTEEEEVEQVEEEEDHQFQNLRESGEACYDDNTLVLYEESSQPSTTISRTKEDEDLVLEHRQAPTPGSTSRQRNHNRTSLVRDCGPGWRHRSGAPTNDELEDFFATVESEKDDRERFIHKYNFDVLNDVPLPGRFEWESLKQT